ncbi:hypothetical protein ACQP2T_60490 [Nonomuraea sp. CA-143628]|uniref:hypothetical protein n=1 Tax=Nonomuraea sp. CA-143628 TaxID=3239997 RepID=UPI003D8ACAA3
MPLVVLPDGREHRADDPAAAQVLSTLLDRPLHLRRQSSVPHHRRRLRSRDARAA